MPGGGVVLTEAGLAQLLATVEGLERVAVEREQQQAAATAAESTAAAQGEEEAEAPKRLSLVDSIGEGIRRVSLSIGDFFGVGRAAELEALLLRLEAAAGVAPQADPVKARGTPSEAQLTQLDGLLSRLEKI